MNKKEELLAEALTDGEGEIFARSAAAQVRRRRIGKQLGLATSAVIAGVAAWFTLQPAKPSALPALPSRPTYEIISDDELLAQFEGQSVLVLKEQERITRVVFLSPPQERKL